MKFTGAYYLHTNHELIYKPAVVFSSDPSYFSSPFVLKVWYITTDFKKYDWEAFLTDALMKGALPLRVKELAEHARLPQKTIDHMFSIPR